MIVTVDVTVIGFGVDVTVCRISCVLPLFLPRGKNSLTVAEVTVFSVIDMKELQKDVAGAWIWLRILIITVTGLHTSTLLISRSFSWAGAPRAGLLKAKTREKGVNTLMAKY